MFKQLLETLQNLDAEQGEVLAKSVQPAQDDKKIQAAAAASGANNGDGNGAQNDPAADLYRPVHAGDGQPVPD